MACMYIQSTILVYHRIIHTVVSRKYAPPLFATLALVQSAGGAYTRDARFSSARLRPPPDREMLSGSVDADGDLQPDCVRVSMRKGSGCRPRSARRKDAPDASGRWRASALRGEEAERFCKVAGVSIVAAGGLRSR